MALASGSRLGAYEIAALIGAGGMGEVYRARDTRLNRDVALKVLPELFAADPDRMARFKREAQVLASLNHPNIAAIYGFEDGPAEAGPYVQGVGASQGVGAGLSRPVHALVLELVEGPTLADRIAQGPIPLDEALPIARQIAEALEAAHEHGIIHRDLKPANIKVRPDGTVKVLDFGLAKAFEADSSSSAALSMSPTITSPAATRVGMILGTAAYMSPEQARGKAVDKRSDIWAFGCVLYEMLTGRRPFDGEEVTDVLARVLERDPDFKAISPAIPPAIRRLLRRCLEKDRKLRLPNIGVARLEIDEAQRTPAGVDAAASAVPRSGTRERLLWAGVAVLMAAVTGTAAYYWRPAPADAPEMRLEIETLRGDNVVQAAFAISPDGLMVAFRSAPGTTRRPQLWVRALASETPQPLPGTEDAGPPFWSPDSRSLAFSVGGQLKRLEIADGRIQTLASTPVSAGGAWNADGTILFTRSFAGPLYHVPATGGEAVEVTRVDPPRHAGHAYPQFLPDGRHFLLFAFGSPEGEGVYVGSLDSMEIRRLVRTDSAAVFAPPDLVLFAQEGALVARRLNLDTWELGGESLTVARQIAVDVINGISAVAASPAGLIAYRSQPAERQLTWLDRSGRPAGLLGESDPAQPGPLKLAPDGRTVALPRTVNGNTDVWLMDTTRGTLRRFTVDPAGDTGPVWSPDASRIVFGSDRRAGNLDLYEKPANGSEPEKVLLESTLDKTAMDWSPDGRFILYASTDAKSGRDIWVLPLFGDRKPIPVAQTASNEQGGRFSPDGRWIAYGSNESGRNEIYVQPFPGPGARSQISTDGGNYLQWRGDGRELFYLTPDNRLMAVSVTVNGSTAEAGTPVALFSPPPGPPYAVSRDGQRFLMAATSEEGSPITVLLNWAGARQAR